MNKLFSFFSARNPTTTKYNDKPPTIEVGEYVELPLNTEIDMSGFKHFQEPVNNQRIYEPQNTILASASNLQVDPRIKTLRIKIIESKNSKISNNMNIQQEQKIQIEVKVKDVRSKELGKKIFISYSMNDLFSQLASSQFFRSFKPVDYQHIENCLTDKSKKSKQLLKYYLLKGEEGEYHGQTNSNKIPEGKGIMYYLNGNKYQGIMKNRYRQGLGTMIYPDGSTYEGDWKLDLQNGFGRYTDKNGEIFEGTFINNSREGKGKLTWKNGYVLEAVWKYGQQEGPSNLIVNNNNILVQWKNGQIVKIDQTSILPELMEQMNPKSQNLIHVEINKGKVVVEQERNWVSARF